MPDNNDTTVSLSANGKTFTMRYPPLNPSSAVESSSSLWRDPRTTNRCQHGPLRSGSFPTGGSLSRERKLAHIVPKLALNRRSAFRRLRSLPRFSLLSSWRRRSCRISNRKFGRHYFKFRISPRYIFEKISTTTRERTCSRFSIVSLTY